MLGIKVKSLSDKNTHTTLASCIYSIPSSGLGCCYSKKGVWFIKNYFVCLVNINYHFGIRMQHFWIQFMHNCTWLTKA
jgi:hypothetical protein